MSDHGKKSRSQADQSKDEQQETAAQSSESTSEDRQGSGSANLAYDFRILPVDPKNSFDFEDVADK